MIRSVIGGNKTKKCSIRMLLLDNPSICDGDTETDQNYAETPQKPVFLRHFRDFFKFFGNPSKFKFWGVSSFFWSISQNCISVSPLFYSNILEGFPNIFEGIPNIFGLFLIFLILFWIFKNFQKSQFVDRFPQILCPFPHIFDPFPPFSKTFENLNF